ncbi:cryptochrome/photolyase family protein [Alpinimonas psychrophila]|uniref:Deoxyribodipyrimidine photolyase-related protein n=1 Tax=Alpinimonas psychrophila TaxID=748908 RepID=A0A7W3JRY7_9MICO|nr:cryptochrome/photolyase family protein [Alpinimonas psychrophila]MBA8828144.1 deoxyribodipyrimidine photolyase-related protein [Alpinimonas psychrophila]
MQQLLFAYQLGPHFDLGEPIVLLESIGRLAARPYHWQKAHLILSAIRHRAQDDNVTLVKAPSYREFLASSAASFTVVNPTSFGYRKLVDSERFTVFPSRGFVTNEDRWASWMAPKSGKGFVFEDFYRDTRRRTGLLMNDAVPIGGAFNFDHENRLPAPKKVSSLPVAPPWQPTEDDIDAGVRRDLMRWQAEGKIQLSGKDGPRLFAVTRQEALAALTHFIAERLDLFGPYEDAGLEGDWAMSHSLLSVPLNFGLLDPLEVALAAEAAYHSGNARLSSVEGFIRQVIGWRDFVWHLYWHFGEDYTGLNFLSATAELPPSWKELDSTHVQANCVSHTIAKVSDRGWLHHIERLMILGNVAMQRGFNPRELNDWFISSFVDGTPWVMPVNVIGMSQFADGGMMSTKPYAGGGAYISKMTNYCGECPYNPKVRVGENACPVTAGYWAFLDRSEAELTGNFRMAQPMAAMRKMVDRQAIREQEKLRGTAL